jgi:hypothetical protein
MMVFITIMTQAVNTNVLMLEIPLEQNILYGDKSFFFNLKTQSNWKLVKHIFAWGCTFSNVRPFYERVVSDLDP